MASGKQGEIDIRFNSSLLFPKALITYHFYGRSSDLSLSDFPSRNAFGITVVCVTGAIDLLFADRDSQQRVLLPFFTAFPF